MLVAEPAAAWQAEHSRERTISLFVRQGASAAAYTRIFCLLGLVQELLLSNQQASQRDVYYRSVKALVILVPGQEQVAALACLALHEDSVYYLAGSSTFPFLARQSMSTRPSRRWLPSCACHAPALASSAAAAGCSSAA